MRYTLAFILCCSMACNENTRDAKPTVDGHLKKNMKGFDLFIWTSEGKTWHSLLPGTNREKDSAEIYNSAAAFDLPAIKRQIDSIAPGEYVFIKPLKVGGDEVNELKAYLEKKGLIVTVSYY